MREETKVTETPTIAEKMGIKYKEVDGLYYPVWVESNTDRFDSVGKYGHRWMLMLKEHDRNLYNKYFLEETLIVKAKEYEDDCLELHDSMVEKFKKSREGYDCASGSIEMIQRIQEIETTVDEIINSDLYEMIDYNKKMRLMLAKADMAQVVQ